jgi:hypothetical protein
MGHTSLVFHIFELKPVGKCGFSTKTTTVGKFFPNQLRKIAKSFNIYQFLSKIHPGQEEIRPSCTL